MIMTGLAFQNQSHPFAKGQTQVEYVTEFSFWALLQSPLVWAGNVLDMTPFQRQVKAGTERLGRDKESRRERKGKANDLGR